MIITVRLVRKCYATTKIPPDDGRYAAVADDSTEADRLLSDQTVGLVNLR